MLDDVREQLEERGGPITGRRTTFPMPRIKVSDAPDDQGRFLVQGYASVFGNRDSYGDIVMPGAFRRSLEERPDVKVLWQHDTLRPVGKQIEGYENEHGLAVTGALTPTDFVKGEAMPLLRDGVVTGLSIGYDIVEARSSDDGFLLEDLELFEWSPVTFPANEEAKITVVRSATELLGGPKDRHVEIAERALKTLAHQSKLQGAHGEAVRAALLSSEALKDLDHELRGRLAAVGDTGAANATDSEECYLLGWQDAVRALKHLQAGLDPKELFNT